jgi:sarcosine dehydrogenase
MTSFVKLEVRGGSCAKALDWLCTSDISGMGENSVVYTQMLNKRGGVEGDVTIARIGGGAVC